MEAISMKSPVLTRIKKGPNFCLLTRARIITEDDLESSQKWNTLKEWYIAIEEDPNHEWIHKAIQSMINAVVYQERIYFAVTREKLTELFSRDNNWSKGISLSPKNYAYLLNEMIDSGIFEAHPENERLKSQRKPMIFRIVDKMVLDLMKVVSEAEQEMQVLNFVENYDEKDAGNNVGNNLGNNVGNTESKKDRKIESKSNSETTQENDSLAKEKKGDITFEQLLLVQYPDKDMPRFEDLQDLARLAITNCNDFDGDGFNIRIFEKHLKNMIKGKITPKQKEYIGKLVNRFQIEAEKNINLEKLDDMNITLKEPKELESKAIKKAIDDTDKVQNETFKILNGVFSRDTIKVLTNKLNKTTDPVERNIIEQEIQFWKDTSQQ